MKSVAGPRSFHLRRCVALVLLVVIGAGCASKPKRVEAKPDYSRPTTGPALVRAAPNEVPDFRQMFNKDPAVLAALDESIAYFKKPSSQSRPLSPRFAEIARSCTLRFASPYGMR